MEREYAAACRRLSGDWRALERGWGQRRRALRCRQRELAARSLRLAALTDTHRSAVSTCLYLNLSPEYGTSYAVRESKISESTGK